MIIFDAHLDLAWNAIDFNRDLRLPVADIRKSEQGMPGKSRGCNTVSFPELRRGGVAIFIATLLARLLRPGPNPAVQRYTSMEAAYGAACGQLAYYRAMEREGWLRWIKDSQTLDAHLRAWEGEAPAEPHVQSGSAGASPSRIPSSPQNSKEPLGFILSMEGADPVLSPDQVHEWYTAGLR